MPDNKEKNYSILIELQVARDGNLPDIKTLATQLNVKALVLDENYEPVMMTSENNNHTCIVHAWLPDPAAEKELGKHPDVVKVWMDTTIAPLKED